MHHLPRQARDKYIRERALKKRRAFFLLRFVSFLYTVRGKTDPRVLVQDGGEGGRDALPGETYVIISDQIRKRRPFFPQLFKDIGAVAFKIHLQIFLSCYLIISSCYFVAFVMVIIMYVQT
jgi:hypothetical protein